MWHSHPINTLKPTKSVLEFMCISPFRNQETKRFQVTYYVALLLIFEAVFSSTFYLKFFYSGEALVHMKNYDTIYVAEHMAWFFLGRFYSLGVLLSLCNRSSQQQLMNRLNALDVRLESNLKVKFTFCRLNVEFIIYSVAIAVYYLGSYFLEGIRNEDNLVSWIYYFCCTAAATFYFVYAFYMVYWARVFLNRSDYILHALETVTSQTSISKSDLTGVMELVKLLFDMRESVQDAFGSMLCIIVMENSFLIAVSMFSLIEAFQQNLEEDGFWTDRLLWALTLWFEFIYIVVCFSRIGGVVSTTCWIHI